VEQRIALEDLPGPLKEAIRARTGPITAARVATAGQNSPLAAIIDTSEGRVFAKGLPSGHRRVITQAREAAVAPLVQHVSPALLWHFERGRLERSGLPVRARPPRRLLPGLTRPGPAGATHGRAQRHQGPR
jgi:hypothetical protein